MNKKIIKIISIITFSSILIGSVCINYSIKADEIENTEYISNWVTDKYSYISRTYTSEDYTGDDIEYPYSSLYKNGVLEKEGVYYERGETAKLSFNVPEDGVYYLNFDYIDDTNSILPIELSMKVNGEYPFYETRQVVFESDWVSPMDKSYDRYGNEIVSTPLKDNKWMNKYIMDSSYRNSEPLGFELKKGKNTITFEVVEGEFYFGNMYLTSEPKAKEFEYGTATGTEIHTIEAEYPSTRNSSSIRALSEFDVNITPYNVDKKELNTLDGTSFDEAGQRVEYTFDVTTEGYYNLALNYRQDTKSDFPVFIDLRIDGEILSKDLPLEYNNGYEFKTLTNENEGIYLETGSHTISFTISSEPIKHVVEAVENIMSEINDLSLEITKVAGTNKDKYRDLKLDEYIPNVGDTLMGYADELDALEKSVAKYSDKEQIGTLYSISVASSQLRSLAEEPNEIPYRVGELVTSTSSVTSFLAKLLDEINSNDISIDRIFVYQDSSEIPSKTGIFKAMYMNTDKFISSFTKQDYSTTNINPESLQVWVNRPRQYLEIMQKMIDEDFTKETGIEVDLSLMPDQNKLILANASGDAPDIATGINYAIPFELGVRGAIVDLTTFSDFSEIANRYAEGLLVPSTIEDGIYSLPETRNFYVMFYRTDILEKLGLEIPDTMEEVKDMLPELQMRGLNFFYPTAGMVAMKTFHGTTPLLFQHGATLYSEFAGDTTINSEEAVEGFKELTELFTIYNLPKDVPSFYQRFRSGDLPIGIADFGTYNLILNAAPEIANSWDVSLIPGVVDENGEVLRYSSGGAESTVMFQSDDEREQKAWEFMKWWSSADVQSEFGQTLQMSYGSEYIWSTANMEAFETLSIPTDDKEVILAQNDWIMEAPRILGTYMLEREMSNAYNKIVVDGDTLRITLDNAVKLINRETERKLEEFGYIKNGEVVKEYTVPDIEKVREILNRE